MNDQPLVLCARYFDVATASIALGVLESEGIPAIIDNGIMGTVFPPAGAVRLMVHLQDLDIAKKILSDGNLLD